MKIVALYLMAALLIATASFGDPTATPTPPAVGTQYLIDLVPGHSYPTGSIDGRVPEVSLSGDTWHLAGGTVVVQGYTAYEETPGACALINLGDGNAHYYRARIWMPIIEGQAEGGILIRASADACTLPNTGDYFYVGFHGSSLGITDSDRRPPDERHYLSGAVVSWLIPTLPAQAQPISEGMGMGWHEDIEVYDDGANVIVLLNGVNVWGTIPIPWYAGNTRFGISGGDWDSVTDAVYNLKVIASDGINPLITPSPTTVPTRTITPTRTTTPTMGPTKTITPTPTITSTKTASATFTATSTITPTPTITVTATATPTATQTPLPFFLQTMPVDNKPRKMRKP